MARPPNGWVALSSTAPAKDCPPAAALSQCAGPHHGSSSRPRRYPDRPVASGDFYARIVDLDRTGRISITKARAFDAKEELTDPDAGSNGSDDNMIDVLEDRSDDPVAQEISGFVNALSIDEQIDLVALVRLGRGDGAADEWSDIRAEAARGHHGHHTARYLLGQPMLGDLLAEGLDELGISFDRGERATPAA